jgi:hypothetical protein
MNLDRYEFSVGRNFLDFEFCSEGPKGKIIKVIRFTPQNANGITYFSLGFGDVNEEANRIDDQSISKNQDRTKILATVAYAVLEFTSYFTDVMIHAKGSTPARTRLYQMGISANLDEVQSVLHVYGFINGEWQPFKKNINYEAFLVKHKKS